MQGIVCKKIILDQTLVKLYFYSMAIILKLLNKLAWNLTMKEDQYNQEKHKKFFESDAAAYRL